MTAAEIISVLTAAKANGVSWLKTEGLEFKLEQEQITSIHREPLVPEAQASPSPQVLSPGRDQASDRIDPIEEEEIKHKIEQLKSVMSLGDEELIDQLFPIPTEETEAAS